MPLAGQLPSDFFIGMDRAMVSLGPLSPKRYCTYACAFCYVHADFQKYPNLDVADILQWLRENAPRYSIVYISGDTDSFAKPRTAEALELVRGTLDLKKDVLFTTRAPLARETIDQLGALASRAKRSDNVLIGCVSISRLRSAAHLEPPPVPTPEVRIQLLRSLRNAGLWTVLAMRPFLPVIPPEEYCELVRLCFPYVDVVLGEAWYADSGGILEDKVLGTGNRLENFTAKSMDFDANEATWKVWEGREVTAVVGNYCESLGVPFFMRSNPAVDLIRSRARLIH